MKQSATLRSLDFDVWMQVAQDDPQRFEAMRKAAIEEFLASVPADKRLQLQRLQWRVDRVRERSASPMAATIAISEMMWDSFYTLRDRYQDIFALAGRRYVQPVQAPKSAKILPFRAPAHA